MVRLFQALLLFSVYLMNLERQFARACLDDLDVRKDILHSVPDELALHVSSERRLVSLSTRFCTFWTCGRSYACGAFAARGGLGWMPWDSGPTPCSAPWLCHTVRLHGETRVLKILWLQLSLLGRCWIDALVSFHDKSCCTLRPPVPLCYSLVDAPLDPLLALLLPLDASKHSQEYVFILSSWASLPNCERV
jgi:hypothetical protein